MTFTPSKVPNYDDDVDFQALAMIDADFAKFYHGSGGSIDFQDPKALQQLTKSILKRDFGLTIELPDNRLCPPVPVRYNYVRWIQDLMDTTSDAPPAHIEKAKVTGLDIGIGASCIYSLLACSSRPSWNMLGTDIDPDSFSSAEKNIANNELNSRITIKLMKEEDPLISLDALGATNLDFTMCNPPFYSSAEDMHASYTNKTDAPSAVCTGAEVEMICPGGDAGFVLRMVEESRELGTKVRWYTSMLGKLSSLHQVVDRLKEIGVTNWAVTLLRAGHKTRRWAVGWSFGDERPRNDIARGSDIGNHILPFPTAQTIDYTNMTKQEAADKLNTILKALDLKWEWQPDDWSGNGTANDNVWSRAARRKRKRVEMEQEDGQKAAVPTKQEEKPAIDGQGKSSLGFKIELRDGDMEVRWLRGKDSVVFESFCGMLKRAINQM